MVFLRKFTLVIAETVLLLLLTVLLAQPEWMIDIAGSVASVDMLLRVVIVIVIDLMIVLAIISQLRGGERYRGKALRVQAGDSMATITTESMRMRLARAIEAIEDIDMVEATVKSQRGAALVTINVATSVDEMNIPNKQREIDRVIKQVVVKQMGVRLADPCTVNIRLASDTSTAPMPPEVEPLEVVTPDTTESEAKEPGPAIP